MKKTFFIIPIFILVILTGCNVKQNNKQVVCTEEAKLCPDGSYVSRTGPNCEFTPCPETNIDSNWKTLTDKTQGIEFKYPENFDTKYIFANNDTMWPPKITSTAGAFTCSDSQKTINNRLYCINIINEGAAGTTYTTFTYTTSLNNKLISINFTLGYPQCMNYDNPKQTECQNEEKTFNVDELADKIIASLKFNN
jgi:hypothetical protein